MTRVLHVRSGQGLYGAEQALLALAAATPPPFRASVVSLVRPGRDDVLSAAARDRGLEAHGLRAPGRLSLQALAPLVRLARGGDAILHAHDYKSLVLSLAAGAVARAPVVVTFHGDTAHTPAVRAYEALAHVLARGVAAVAAPSEALAEVLRRRAPRTPVHVIRNGIPLRAVPSPDERRAARAHLGLPDDARVVAFLGRLAPEKGPAVLLEAVRALDVRLLVAGDGPLRAELEAAAPPGTRFLGFVPDVRAVLAAADVVALPSLTEGLPLAALEAMAAGRPVVASAVGALPELLGEGAGLLVAPGDARALSQALERALGPDGVTLTRVARGRVETRHSAETMAAACVRVLYEPALRRRAGAASVRAATQPR